MIIDTGFFILTPRLVGQCMAMLNHLDDVDRDTPISFHFYPGSGWTVEIESDEKADLVEKDLLRPWAQK